jgi:hypothetical protein
MNGIRTNTSVPIKFAVAIEHRGKLKLVEVPTTTDDVRNLTLEEIAARVLTPALAIALEKAGVPYRRTGN